MKRPVLKDRVDRPSGVSFHFHFINLSIIAFALGTSLFMVFAEKWDCQRAVKEIAEIQKLSRGWAPDWFAKHATGTLVAQGDTYHNHQEKFVDRCDFARLLMSEPQSNVLADHRIKWWRSWTDIGGPTDYIGNPSSWNSSGVPGTLKEFAVWWNELAKGVIFYKPLRMSMFGQMDYQESVPPVEISEENHLTGSNQWIRLDCIEEREAKRFHADKKPLPTLILFPAVEKHDDWLGIKAETIVNEADWVFHYRVNTWFQLSTDQHVLLAEFPDWRIGPFESSFVDLSRAAVGMEQLDFASLRNHLSSDVTNYRHMIRVGRFKISVIRAAEASIALLLIGHLYIFAMQRRFQPVALGNKLKQRRKMRKPIHAVFARLYWLLTGFYVTAAILLTSAYALRDVFQKNTQNVYLEIVFTSFILISIVLSTFVGLSICRKFDRVELNAIVLTKTNN